MAARKPQRIFRRRRTTRTRPHSVSRRASASSSMWCAASPSRSAFIWINGRAASSRRRRAWSGYWPCVNARGNSSARTAPRPSPSTWSATRRVSCNCGSSAKRPRRRSHHREEGEDVARNGALARLTRRSRPSRRPRRSTACTWPCSSKLAGAPPPCAPSWPPNRSAAQSS
jgi:hypothetical protein